MQVLMACKCWESIVYPHNREFQQANTTTILVAGRGVYERPDGSSPIAFLLRPER